MPHVSSAEPTSSHGEQVPDPVLPGSRQNSDEDEGHEMSGIVETTIPPTIAETPVEQPPSLQPSGSQTAPVQQNPLDGSQDSPYLRW